MGDGKKKMMRAFRSGEERKMDEKDSDKKSRTRYAKTDAGGAQAAHSAIIAMRSAQVALLAHP